MKIFTVIFLLAFCSIAVGQNVRFAVIGDYGKAGTNELDVSNLVKSRNPEFIITLGDNNYELGEASTIDTNIGQYYHQFIYPYTGSYGQGDSVNRFFPSLGNHDWYTNAAQAYLDYFALPSNERYYDFVKGDIHFFSIDSDPNEPDGVDSNSVQAMWLKNALANSDSKWNLVYFHHPPYSSSEHGNQEYMQWSFAKWGATAVLAGHDHSYERLFIDSIYYFVNGLGGKTLYSFVNIVEGSQFRYNSDYGAMQVNSYDDSLAFEFYSVSGNRIDHHVIFPAVKTLQTKILIEGMYDSTSNRIVSDSVCTYLRRNFSPYELIDSAKSVFDSNGCGSFKFHKAANATGYYLVIKHRNSVETWSSVKTKFIANFLNYDFTDSSSRVYGDNLVRVDHDPVAFAIFSGDPNQDGSVDLSDVALVFNDAFAFVTGYFSSDINGDNLTDLSDLIITINNSSEFVGAIRP